MNKCKCTVDETTGWTQVKCCNICGKPVEDFWNVPEPIGKMYSGKDVADMMRAAYKAGCKIDLKELQPVLHNVNNEQQINEFAIEALSVLSKVLHALQHSNMKGTILHSQIKAAVVKGMNCPLKVQLSEPKDQ